MKRIILIAVALMFMGQVNAADIKHHARAKTATGYIKLEGKIAKGDYEQLKNLLRIGHTHEVFGIHLASLGGDFFEAMKIGRLIRCLKLRTVTTFLLASGLENLSDPTGFVEYWEKSNGTPLPINTEAKDKKNALCFSVCFFIHVAGINRRGNRLGIHRPYLPSKQLVTLTVDEAASLQAVLRKEAREYLHEMNVPAFYVEKIFSTPPDDLYLLKGDEVNTYFDSYIPAISNWIAAQCSKVMSLEERAWLNMYGAGRCPKSECRSGDTNTKKFINMITKDDHFKSCQLRQGQ